MPIRARTRPQSVPEPAPVDYPLKSETYTVHASRYGEQMVTYMALEPNIDRAVAKANELWACGDISRVEVTAEKRYIIGRKSR